MSAARSRRRGSKDLPDEEPPPREDPVPVLEEAEPAAAAASSLRGVADTEVRAIADDPSARAILDDSSPRFAAEGLPSRPGKSSKESNTSSEVRFKADRRKSAERPTKDSNTSSRSSEVRFQVARRKTSERPTKESNTSSRSSEVRFQVARRKTSERPTKESNTSSEVRFQSPAESRSESKDSNASSSERRNQSRPVVVDFELEDQEYIVERDESVGDASEAWSDADGAVALRDSNEEIMMYEPSEEDGSEVAVKVPEEDMHPEELKRLVQVNTNGMLAFLCFAVLWVFSAAALMLALTWHYVWVEVEMQADRAAESAVDHGSFHASEVLSPATAVMKTLDLGFRGGAIKSIGDYAGFYKVLEPFFEALPELRDVEMADTPEYLRVGPGSVSATRIPHNGIELRSDRGDCAHIPSGRGCALEPQRANTSSWFEERVPFYPHPWNPLPMHVAWDGPSFARDSPHEAICDELCWSPTYSLASRISGGTDPFFAHTNESYDPFHSVIVRVTMEATIFIDVVKQIQMRSRGEAFICTNQGRVVAAVEMADTLTADASTGIVRMVDAHEFPRTWAVELDPGMVALGDGQSKLVGDGEYLVSAWRMESPHNATATLGESLRIVVAIPSQVYADSVLTSLRIWFIAVSTVPVAFTVLATIANLYLRCRRKRGKQQLKDMSIEELQRVTKENQEKLRRHKQKLKEQAEADHAFARDGSGLLRRSTTVASVVSAGSWLHRRTSRVFNRASSRPLSPDASQGSSPYASHGSSQGASGFFRRTFSSRFFRRSDSGSPKALADVNVDDSSDGSRPASPWTQANEDNGNVAQDNDVLALPEEGQVVAFRGRHLH